MAAPWQNNEDFLHDDLDIYSEIGFIDTIQEPLPPTILEYNARIGANRNSSIYDTPALTEDSGIIVCAPRGRGRGSFNLLRPGIVAPSKNSDDDDIRRRLKLVNPIGYSNEVIEEKFRQSKHNIKKLEKEFSDVPEVHSDSSQKSATSSPSKTSNKSHKNSNTPSSSSPTARVTSSISNGFTSNRTPLDASSSFCSSDSNPCIIEDEDIDEFIYTPIISSSNSSSRPESVIFQNVSPIPVPVSSNSPLPVQAPSPPVSSTRLASPQAPPPLSEMLRRAKKERKSPEQPVAKPVVPKPMVPKPVVPKPVDTNGHTSNSDIGKNILVNGTRKMNGKESGKSSPSTSTMNGHDASDYWWNQGYDSSTSDESLSWRRRDTNSPPRFRWRRDIMKQKKNYDIKSSDDFPAL